MDTHRFLIMGVSVPTPVIGGRVRAAQRRLKNDAGWFAFRGISDFGAIGHVLKGRESRVVERFDRYAACGMTVVRCAGMLGHSSWAERDLAFSPRDARYWEALDRTIQLANQRGLYVELFLFADAQIVVPDAAERQRWTGDFARFLRDRVGVIPQMANEPFKNGWASCVDPLLLALADEFAGIVGHQEFSVGDPADVASSLAAEFEKVSRHSNFLVVHPDRSQPPGDSRWRRWIDHLEGFTELPDVSNAVACLVLDEPIGAHPVYRAGTRDNDPDAFVAAQVVACCCGCGFTYHWIPEEGGQFAVEQLPGITPEVGALLAQLPVSPDWTYKNEGWPGSPTNGITWSGLTGKVRHLVRGNQAWSVAYGEANFETDVRWNPGWTPRVVWRGQRVRVWAVNQ